MSDLGQSGMYDLMPPLRRAYFFTAVLNRVQNAADSKAIAAWITLIAAGIVAAGGGLSFLWVAVTSQSFKDFVRFHPNALLVLASSGIALLLVIVILVAQGKREQETLRRADTLADFKILQMVTLCHVRSAESLVFYHRYWFKLKKDNVRQFEMDFNWSSAPDTLSVSVRDPRLTWQIVPTSRVGVRRLIINLPDDLAAGHREAVEFAFVTDTAGRQSALPFVSLSAPSNKFPHYNTYLIVSFDKAVRPARLYRERFFSAQVEKPIKREVVELNSDNYHSWSVDVRPGWRSSLRWVYAGEAHGS